MTYKIAAVTVLCFLALVNGHDKFQGNTKPCHPNVYEKLDSCCTMPKLLPVEVFRSCFASQRPRLFEQSGRSKRAAQAETGTVIKRRSFGPPGGPMCLIDCVFNNQSLLNENGEPNLQAIQDKFVSEAPENWKELIKEVSNNCYNELQKVDFGNATQPPADVKVCKPNSAMLLSCIRRQLTLRCPDSELKTDAACPERIAKLKECDPFAIPAPRSLLNGNLMKAIKKGSKSLKGVKKSAAVKKAPTKN